jgi:hypothetical protein
VRRVGDCPEPSVARIFDFALARLLWNSPGVHAKSSRERKWPNVLFCSQGPAIRASLDNYIGIEGRPN